jgi:hypothetical protein
MIATALFLGADGSRLLRFLFPDAYAQKKNNARLPPRVARERPSFEGAYFDPFLASNPAA